jgi:hypothetical protein
MARVSVGDGTTCFLWFVEWSTSWTSISRAIL